MTATPTAAPTPSPTIPLTVEQCREALTRLQQYAGWMYHTPAGLAQFAKNRGELEGRVFSFSIEPDGRIAMTIADNGAKAIYETLIAMAPPDAGSLDNVVHHVRLVNRADLTPVDAAFADNARVFASSLFQRTTANQFICRMTPETIDIIARDLSLAQ